MTKKFLFFVLPLSILFTAANVEATSCQDDFNEIAKIARCPPDGVITRNKMHLGFVFGPVTTGSDGSCGAWGKITASFWHKRYAVFWMRGHWKKTIVAYRRKQAAS